LSVFSAFAFVDEFTAAGVRTRPLRGAWHGKSGSAHYFARPVGAKSIPQLQTAWSLTNGKKTRLGDELFTQLQTIKDGRKAQLLEVA